MVGDCSSSFIKRRFGYPSGAKALWLDQIPESLLPMLGLSTVLNLSALGLGLTVVRLVVVELVWSVIGYKRHMRKHPYERNGASCGYSGEGALVSCNVISNC